MPAFPESPSRGEVLFLRVCGSLVCAAVGWVAMNLATFLAFVSLGPVQSAMGMLTLGTPVTLAIVFAVWLPILLPLYLFVPEQSLLWDWRVCAGCGVTGGVFVMELGSMWMGFPFVTEWRFLLCAAVTGGATCLCGSLTASVFLPEPRGTKPPPLP